MSVDIYVGPLSRYYAHDWETVAARASRASGVEFVTVWASAPRVLPKSRAVNLVEVWRSELAESLRDDLEEELDWPESLSAAYHTDQIAWEGLTAVRLLAAHDDHPEVPTPEVLREPDDDPAWIASTADEYSDTRYPQLLAPDLWLPIQHDLMFETEDPVGDVLPVGSVGSLLGELEELNERTLRATVEQLAEWRRSAPDGSSLDEWSRYGLAILTAMARLAHSMKMPMKLDF